MGIRPAGQAVAISIVYVGDTGATPSEQEVRSALSAVVDPELGDDIVSLGMVRNIDIASDGLVIVDIALTIAGCAISSSPTWRPTSEVSQVYPRWRHVWAPWTLSRSGK
jgi:metal-sulfur cluster biosynthetic enzyme